MCYFHKDACFFGSEGSPNVKLFPEVDILCLQLFFLQVLKSYYHS